MVFSQVAEFFKSWGLYPSEEDTDDFNSEAIAQGINRACYDRMRYEAELTGDEFGKYCGHVIDATDDMFYLEVETWNDLEEDWNEWANTHGVNWSDK